VPISITLSGGKSTRFEDIKRRLETELGYEPTNPEVIGYLMARVESVSMVAVAVALARFVLDGLLAADAVGQAVALL